MFSSKHYPTLMYIVIITLFIAIFFQILNIITNNPDIKTRIEYNKLTSFAGLATENESDNATSAIEIKDEALYSEQAYGRFYFIILIIFIAIFFFAAMLIIPRIKKYT